MSEGRRVTARERIMVALDVPSLAAAEGLLDRLQGAPAFYKIGLELFVAEGARAVAAVKARGGRVFLDLKLHDIPETVSRAVEAARALGVDFVTVHASGGIQMVERAVAAAQGALGILAVTVLTSLSEADLATDGFTLTPGEVVKRRAALAAAAGAAGLVCSVHEVAALRAAHPGLVLVVPGIRPAGAALGDQKRVGTPAQARAVGADFLVVGRPLRDAPDPAQAFAALVAEVDAADQPRS